MAEVEAAKGSGLSQDYLLKDKEENVVEIVTKPVEDEAEKPLETPSEEAPISQKPEETQPASENEPTVEAPPSPAIENDDKVADAGENTESSNESVGEATDEAAAAATESDENQVTEEEEKPEIQLETAPADFRFPTTNQTRHCFTRYIEYHRCVAAKGDDAPECDKFAKYYRSLCPGEWVDRWNEQRENGTFAGPL
ncbi:cytochrome c oxidase subunit 6b-1-like [Impatiens glandulifera]|uniref:cytochrome c oxidase subunit 6b-1-like n=1 Tax=Impatiens glandulifera TaxID=253017 RepID=UPI001FB081B7|nr:cytochrome c oxidase subunit 6b-1-like [Impatiens glandulifera]